MADHKDELPVDMLVEEILIALAANDELDLQAEEALEAALAHQLGLELAIQKSVEYLARCLLELGVTLMVGLVAWAILSIEITEPLNLDDQVAVTDFIHRMMGP